MKRKIISAVFVCFLVLSFPFILNSRESNVEAQSNAQAEIDILLEEYNVTLQQELLYGTTQEINDPDLGATKILIGESQVKMDILWAETFEKIKELQSRPEANRSRTVTRIRQVSGYEPMYVGLARSPNNISAEIEEYESGPFIYQVEVQSEQIVKIWIKNQQNFSIDKKYSKLELLDMAQKYVSNISPEIVFDTSSLTIRSKDDIVYFFRWEYATNQTLDGTIPFVQIAFSHSGEFLNYENTLPYSSPTKSNFIDQLLRIQPVFAIGANEYYSNGGTQWGWEVQNASYSTKDNAGFCYTQGSWCAPKNFYFAPSPSGNNTYSGTNHRGKWTATSYMRNLYSRTSAYIPCTNATAFVLYFNWYNGGSSHTENGVNQQIWCDSWVNSSALLYDIQRVVLANTSETCCNKEIAWDEIWDYVP